MELSHQAFGISEFEGRSPDVPGTGQDRLLIRNSILNMQGRTLCSPLQRIQKRNSPVKAGEFFLWVHHSGLEIVLGCRGEPCVRPVTIYGVLRGIYDRTSGFEILLDPSAPIFNPKRKGRTQGSPLQFAPIFNLKSSIKREKGEHKVRPYNSHQSSI